MEASDSLGNARAASPHTRVCGEAVDNAVAGRPALAAVAEPADDTLAEAHAPGLRLQRLLPGKVVATRLIAERFARRYVAEKVKRATSAPAGPRPPGASAPVADPVDRQSRPVNFDLATRIGTGPVMELLTQKDFVDEAKRLVERVNNKFPNLLAERPSGVSVLEPPLAEDRFLDWTLQPEGTTKYARAGAPAPRAYQNEVVRPARNREQPLSPGKICRVSPSLELPRDEN